MGSYVRTPAHPTHNMKFLVFSACVAISCGQLASWGNLVRHSNGALVPADTPAVVAARAAFHMAAGVNHPLAGNAAGPRVNHANGAAVHAAGAVQPSARAAQPVAAYVHNGLVEHPNGAVVPAEPAEVVAAKRAHLQLASVPIAYILEDNLFVYPNGVIVPAEGAEVMAARRAHLAALANA